MACILLRSTHNYNLNKGIRSSITVIVVAVPDLFLMILKEVDSFPTEIDFWVLQVFAPPACMADNKINKLMQIIQSTMLKDYTSFDIRDG